MADNIGYVPPVEVTEAPAADWTALEPAIGRTPADSGMLSKGPIVTDLSALLGPNSARYRAVMEQRSGPLRRDGALLVAMTPPGPQAAYLIVDTEQLALEAGFRNGGEWIVRRTHSAELARPASVEALVAG